MDRPVGFLVVAAGHSRRFGACKLSAKLTSGAAILEQVLQRITPIGAPVAVVLSPDKPHLHALVAESACQPLILPNPSLGLGHSISFGVKATAKWAGWVICLADMPWITTVTYSKVHALLTSSPQAAPLHNGCRGHPVGFQSQYYSVLAALKGDMGAARHLSLSTLATFDANDNGCLRDIDTPEDIFK